MANVLRIRILQHAVDYYGSMAAMEHATENERLLYQSLVEEAYLMLSEEGRRKRTSKVRTKDNTGVLEWTKFALAAFRERGLPRPTGVQCHDAYELGESPETWADYVNN